MALTFTKADKLSLKSHPQYSEAWVRDRIIEDPSLLGLGDLEVRHQERIQPSGGRLDLLLVDPESEKWYELELMLGAVDESHIIRTIEYWDVERKRYPQYDHVAVLVAEDITTRFLNVISLFNSAIPIVALQMNALQVGEHLVLHFTKVLDEVLPGEPLGMGENEQASRLYWEKKASPQTITLIDECFTLLREINDRIQPRYTKRSICVIDDCMTGNYMVFRPRQRFVSVSTAVPDPGSWKERIEEDGLSTLPISRRNHLRFHLRTGDLMQHRELLREVFSDSLRAAHE